MLFLILLTLAFIGVTAAYSIYHHRTHQQLLLTAEQIDCLVCDHPIDGSHDSHYTCPRCRFDSRQAKHPDNHDLIEDLRDLKIARADMALLRTHLQNAYRGELSSERRFSRAQPSDHADQIVDEVNDGLLKVMRHLDHLSPRFPHITEGFQPDYLARHPDHYKVSAKALEKIHDLTALLTTKSEELQTYTDQLASQLRDRQ